MTKLSKYRFFYERIKKERDMKKILLIEDDMISSELIMDILELCGCDVKWATDGQEALALLEKESFDLILTDIHLPRMDGIAFIQEVKKMPKAPAKYIVAITADAATKDGKKFQDIGYDGHIQKPFKLSEFRAYICSLLEDK
jgi:CheY-like chemotaxis protein